MIPDWPALKTLALSLNLPEVTTDSPWGHEALKAHGKMWCWWSPYADAAVFKCGKAEREMLLAADPAVKLSVHLAVEAGQGANWAKA